MGMGGNGNVESHSRTSLVQDTSRHYTAVSDECQLVMVSDADRRLRSSVAPSFVVPWTRTRLGDMSRLT